MTAIRGLGLNVQGGGSASFDSQTEIEQYEYLILSPFKFGGTDDSWMVSVHGTYPGVKALMYKAAADVADDDLLHTSASSRNSKSGVAYFEANTNHWLLKDAGGSPVGAYSASAPDGSTINYLGDIENAGFRAAWAANVIDAATVAGADGVFIDNVLGYLAGSAPVKTVGGAAYTDATWATAMSAFVAAVVPLLQTAGLYVIANTYTSGDDGSDDAAWFGRIAPNVDGCMAEYWMQTSVDLTRVRHEAAAWDDYFSGHLAIADGAQINGAADFFGLAANASGDTTVRDYTRAAWLLKWDGGTGGAMVVSSSDGSDMGAWAADQLDPGLPVREMEEIGTTGAPTSGTNLWLRYFAAGVVLLNADPSATYTVTDFGDGRSYVDATDAPVTSPTLGPGTALILYTTDAFTGPPGSGSDGSGGAGPSPTPTFSGGPTVTFPAGCASPPVIHVEFTVPTFDRSPARIPDSFIGEAGADGIGAYETLGPRFGVCLLTSSPGFEIQVPTTTISTGLLPALRTGKRWFGLGVTSIDLYVDGVFYATVDSGGIAEGSTVSTDVATDFALDVDWATSHSFTIKVHYEDVPAYRYWGDYHVITCCLPVIGTSVAEPVWDWATARATEWPAGFDPGGGLNWGPFGTDVPTFKIEETVEFIAPFALAVEHTVTEVTYTYTSPPTDAVCEFTGFFDPANGSSVDDNTGGTGGDPTHDGAVAISTDWGCQDSTSFKFTGHRDPAYITYVPPTGGDFDQWYYQAMTLFIPSGLGASKPDGDLWLLMGVRQYPNVGSPAWADLMNGVALKLDVHGAFTAVSFLGSADSGAAIAYSEWGDPIPVVEGVPQCVQFAIKRESDTSGTRNFHFWQFAVDDAQSDVQATRSLYNRPNFAEWGVIDNRIHDGLLGTDPSIYYGDDLRFDTTPLGCRCRAHTIKGWQRF